MKFKHVVASFGLTLAMGFSAAAGLLANKEVKEVRADAPETDTVMYVDFSNVNSWWFSGSLTKIHAFAEGKEAVDLDVTLVEKQLYKFTLEAGYTTFIVARLNAEEPTQWWNQSHDVNYSSSFNLVTLKDTKSYDKNEYSVSTLVKYVDDYLIVDAYQSSSYWGNDDAHIYVCYYYGDSAWGFSEFSSPNAPVGKTNLYSIRLSFYADRFVVVRGTADFAGFVDGWEEKVWNKTTDIVFTSENKDCKFVKLGTSIPESKDVTVAGFEQISSASFVDSYCYQFLQLGLCLDAGGLDENFETNFDLAETAFNNMKSYASYHSVNLKTSLQAVDNTADSNAGHAMKRYDTIMAKNEDVASEHNFLERSIDSSLALVRVSFADANNSNISIIIICVAAVSTLAFTLLLVFKKKRK